MNAMVRTINMAAIMNGGGTEKNIQEIASDAWFATGAILTTPQGTTSGDIFVFIAGGVCY